MLLTKSEIKAVLKFTNEELEQKKRKAEITYTKKNNTLLYSLPKNSSVLSHPLGSQLVNWHRGKHNLEIENSPNHTSMRVLELLIYEILLPIERHFSRPTITYGFTGPELSKRISKDLSSGTAPQLDQHSSAECNSTGKLICKRGGAACDFYVAGVPSSELTQFITQHLNYDRLYYYGKDRPIHTSVSVDTPRKHLQLMNSSQEGRRYPGKKAFGEAAIKLAKEL